MNHQDSNATLAVFLDLENIALGAREAHYPEFSIQKVLEKLLLKGHIVVKKAYCDFERYKDFKRGLHEAAFELIEIPHVRQSGKNSADIRMVVDALDLCYTNGHVDTFAIISGDSDFSPLVSKLRENAKTVVGVGVKKSSSDLFINNCDEFIYYDDLVRETTVKANKPSRPSASATKPAAKTSKAAPAAATSPTKPTSGENKGPSLEEAFDMVSKTLEALVQERGPDRLVHASLMKQAIKRLHPGFNERAHGFSSFTVLLEEAAKRGLLKLRRDEKTGSHTVQPVE
jgi:uncharacterized protein (TIGR00288 family)